ncbi:ankyrin repeat-containing protein [Senna tora]|uniref:Ankyrin repeat-containing protein n=1 Tax=Senna tora TaxID=362788 RepID=A0A834TBV1_9FABA|nr:ankyrin repeat-containing protein [Senna tora]
MSEGELGSEIIEGGGTSTSTSRKVFKSASQELEYLKYDVKKEKSSIRNALLTTYQAAISPPGGLWQDMTNFTLLAHPSWSPSIHLSLEYLCLATPYVFLYLSPSLSTSSRQACSLLGPLIL